MSRSLAVQSQLAINRNLSLEDRGRMQDYANRVAYAESKGDPQAVQKSRRGGTGPGRGAFQFEMKAGGGSGGGKTAANRLMAFAKQYSVDLKLSDDERAMLESDDPDFSKLPYDIQEAALFANANYHPKFPLSDLATGKLDMGDAYRLYHYAGPEVERIKKHWADSSEAYDARRRSRGQP
tara:strand:- start:1721 stop:2260 length:540 start_codon:yes stop_codon:yes gene_type:complete